jgi:hypothetical protein
MRNAILNEWNGLEYELEFRPLEDVTHTQVGNKLIVSYLVQDEDPLNPMKEFDANGTLFTKPSRYGGGAISDSRDWGSHLGLTEYGDPNLEDEAVVDRATSLIRAHVCKDPDFIAWALETFEEFSWIEDCFDSINWRNDWVPGWLDTILENMLPTAWNQLYAEGKIGDYLAVPVSYSASVHGPGTTSISTTDIDSCDAVWVPDQDCIDNMTFLPSGIEIEYEGNGGGNTGKQFVVRDKGQYVKGFDKFPDALQFVRQTYQDPITHADKMRAASKYAEGVLDEYQNFCNGEVFGTVVQVFEIGEGSLTQVDEDSCWGFIGDEYAESALKETVAGFVERFEKEICDEPH